MMLLSFLVLVGKVLNTDQTKPTKPGNDPDLFPFLIGKVLTSVRLKNSSSQKISVSGVVSIPYR